MKILSLTLLSFLVISTVHASVKPLVKFPSANSKQLASKEKIKEGVYHVKSISSTLQIPAIKSFYNMTHTLDTTGVIEEGEIKSSKEVKGLFKRINPKKKVFWPFVQFQIAKEIRFENRGVKLSDYESYGQQWKSELPNSTCWRWWSNEGKLKSYPALQNTLLKGRAKSKIYSSEVMPGLMAKAAVMQEAENFVIFYRYSVDTSFGKASATVKVTYNAD